MKQRYPSEVVEVVNPPFQKALFQRLRPLGDGVYEPATGELVPGLGVREGGTPLTLRFKANGDAEAVADQHAAQLVKEVTAGLGIGEKRIVTPSGNVVRLIPVDGEPDA